MGESLPKGKSIVQHNKIFWVFLYFGGIKNTKNYDVVLFDLDGTLTNPGEGITNSVIYSLKKYNIQIKDRLELYKFIGPPLHESYEKYFGFSKEEAKKAVE